MFRNDARVFGSEAEKATKVSATLIRFMGYFKKYWLQYVFVAFMMGISTWSQVVGPELMGEAVDCYLIPAGASSLGAGGDSPLANIFGSNEGAEEICARNPAQADWTSTDYLAGLGGVVLKIAGLYILGSITTGLMFYVMVWSGQHVLKALRIQVFDQINRLSIGYHVEHEAGDIMSRVTNDADTIQQGMTFALVQVLSGIVLIVWTGISMMQRNVPYALISLAIVPLMIIATLW
ncbi:MAG: ABC transporter transmembrane domain-containing protein, partial [Chloroflexota bacterium]